jgi:serine/threonine protein kinase/Flp pilus assembly protein TadD
MNDHQPTVTEKETRLAEVLDAYLAEREAGTAPRPEELLARHPDLAGDLKECLASLAYIKRASVKAPEAGPAGNGTADAEAPGGGVLGDFRIVREVGRGGMGVVYEAEQVSLGRRVALKVLPFAGALDPRQLQRFKTEAQAAACLQHTSIVPVYYVGCERGVHFYAMQYIDGQPLAAVIKDLRQLAGTEAKGPGPGEPGEESLAHACASGRWAPPRAAAAGEPTTAYAPAAPAAGTATQAAGLLSTEPSVRTAEYFRTVARLGVQAAEALEHAHEQGVIHRDVKPGNLLLDGRGHLWVTDFGLARLQTDAGLTMTGDLVGTLRYMSPEQALAQRVVIDHRTDLYSLGATLYELLTLQPAFTGTDRQELLRQIAFEEPRPSRRLNKAIPAELETVVLKALEKNPADRYGTAQELADDLRRFLEDKPIWARRPTLWQRAVKWARRHRPVVGAVAAVLLLALATAGAFGWRELRQQADTERQVELALREVTIFQGEAKWPEALAAVKRAEVLLESRRASDLLRRRAHDLHRDLDMAAELEEIRLRTTGVRGGGGHSSAGFDLDHDHAAYLKAFLTCGIDLEALDPAQVGELVRAQAIRQELVTALDHWARLLTESEATKETGKRLLRIARLADTDEGRNRVRLAVEQEEIDVLKALARADQAKSLPPSMLGLVAGALRRLGAKQEALTLLREAQWRHPGDYWINLDLADLAIACGDRDEWLRFKTAALAARPRDPTTHTGLGWGLMSMGRLKEAAARYREAVRLRPDYAHAHNGRGVWLLRQGLLDEAATEFQEAIRLDKDYAAAHSNLGNVLRKQGRNDEAIAECREALRLKKDFPEVHYNLGRALAAKGLLDEAIAAYREALRLKKDFPGAHIQLGNVLRTKGRLDEATAEYREVLCLFKKQDGAESYNAYSWYLSTLPDLRLRDPKQALVYANKAVELKPQDGNIWNTLGAARYRAQDWQGAVEALRKSMALKKGGDSFDWFFLAMAHWQMDHQEEARKWYDKAVPWMDKNKSQDDELRRFRAEAEALLGVKDSLPRNGKEVSPR